MSTSTTELKQDSTSAVSPIPLMQMATAFWAFKTLATAVDMDLFTHLSTTPMTSAEMAKWFRIEERPAEMLLTGCAGLGLLSKRNGRYCNYAFGRELSGPWRILLFWRICHHAESSLVLRLGQTTGGHQHQSADYMEP